MKCIGIAIAKNELYYTVMSGNSKNDAIIELKGILNFQSESKTLMTDFFNLFNELITKYKPDSIGYKLFLDSTKDQIRYMVYSLGILEFICEEKNIITQERNSSWISAGKKKKLIDFVNKYGNQKKVPELHASVIAWNQFGE